MEIIIRYAIQTLSNDFLASGIGGGDFLDSIDPRDPENVCALAIVLGFMITGQCVCGTDSPGDKKLRH